MAVKKNTLLIVAGSLLILLLIGVTILLISEKQTNKELVMEFNLDKEDREEQQCHRDTPSEEGTGLSPQSHDRLYQPD